MCAACSLHSGARCEAWCVACRVCGSRVWGEGSVCVQRARFTAVRAPKLGVCAVLLEERMRFVHRPGVELRANN